MGSTILRFVKIIWLLFKKQLTVFGLLFKRNLQSVTFVSTKLFGNAIYTSKLAMKGLSVFSRNEYSED
jgi:hypothetical protein